MRCGWWVRSGGIAGIGLGSCLIAGCRQPAVPPAPQGQAMADALANGNLQGFDVATGKSLPVPRAAAIGFDRNIYPGDARLAALHGKFAFVGYWLNAPPGSASAGETSSSWTGKRLALRDAGFGFLVLWNGRLEAEIKASGLAPEALGRKDATEAVAAATREGFPAGVTLFLDQEEGGRLTELQSSYFFAWTKAVDATGDKAGAYLSGQPVPDGSGPDGRPATITTADVVRQEVAQKHLHPVALWVYNDACPPAPGCTVQAPALAASGTQGVVAWQYAQSPRRPDTVSCKATYAEDKNCYAGVTNDVFLDLDVADSPDPSHGR
jgi:hypothetical protein